MQKQHWAIFTIHYSINCWEFFFCVWPNVNNKNDEFSAIVETNINIFQYMHIVLIRQWNTRSRESISITKELLCVWRWNFQLFVHIAIRLIIVIEFIHSIKWVTNDEEFFIWDHSGLVIFRYFRHQYTKYEYYRF